MLIYANKVGYAEHIALVKGDITRPSRCWPACTR